MNSYKGADWAFVSSRGWIARLTVEHETPSPNVGARVLIDGRTYDVRGVERAINLTLPPKPSRHMGILIHGEPKALTTT